ncbi:MAG: sigma-54-dependent Fis family transcriptional regulator [Ignavibacteriae bacterium]|nr:sigma-54-dependent Fis family transcriptional regulator [Ignavibacteria bacterium]MBI3364778.1 sigma-54-dependent Fis family transcriptional regulator [Ignavibacteriota bacterium]
MEKEKKTKAVEEKRPGAIEYPIIGKSRVVEQLLKQISRLAKNRRDIMIIGEAGVGKGAVAKNVYSLDRVPDEKSPFMSINLSVLDDRELEAVLFGHDRGVEGLPYTTKRGLFEIANGGTVLIEEIEEASFRNQMKILAFMNERTTRRIGGTRPESIDIRLIVTLKEDPKGLVEKRKLLEDLYNRLADFERVEIPPLRERPEDIPLLVKHFAGELCREIGIGELIIDINAIDVLVRQSWRENIRELKAVVDKSVLFSNGGRFMLPPELVDEKTEVVKMINNLTTGQDFILDKSLDAIEKGIIERALQKFGFNQSRSASFLGMTEQTLRYKLKRLNIASSRSRV